MAMSKARIAILRVAYETGARDVADALDCDQLVRRLATSWEKIRQEVAYLTEKGYMKIKERQVGPRIYRSVYLTAEGVDVVESSAVRTAAPKPQQSIPIKLQLSMQNHPVFAVRALETPFGESRGSSELPYSEEELMVILEALRLPQYQPDHFSQEERRLLDRLGLVRHDQFIQDLHDHVGTVLYSVLTPGKDIYAAFEGALDLARKRDAAVALQLRFDEDAVELARYPWELLYHKRSLLASGAVELTRYVTYSESMSSLPVSPPLELLYLRSRPRNLSALPEELEENAVQEALHSLAEDLLTMRILPRPTWETFLDELESREIHILHFDGHGVFARQCPKCGAMNWPIRTSCKTCGQDVSDTTPRGFLAFEDARRQVDWISHEQFGTLLHRRSLRLVVLSACWSGGIGGETLFGGIAPALIQTGVPAVVATQLPITVAAATRFLKGFYRALARFESVPAAVNDGRIRIFDTNEWFVPTLYLRSRDEQGHLFLFDRKENS